MKNSFLHCCAEMHSHLDSGELHFSYDPKFREYGIDYQEAFGGGVQLMTHCPWCGKNLPDSLRRKWFEELERMGLDPDGELPNNMLTDEWWQLTCQH